MIREQRPSAADHLSSWDLYYEPDWDFMRDDPRFQELASPVRTMSDG